jgi:hypothetical protein
MGSRGGGEERERVEKVRKIGGLKEQAKYLFFSALLTFTDGGAETHPLWEYRS